MNETKFSGKAEIYSHFRPSYPQSFIEYLKYDLPLNNNTVIADIGSGTGILTKQLLSSGLTVYAVEPNDDMRNVAEKDLSHYNNFHSVNADAENTTLPDKSIDYITVAQAFHWFDAEKFSKECKRILKPDGKVILVWNNRDDDSEMVKENEKINHKYCPQFKGFSGSKTSITDQSDLSYFFTKGYTVKVFDNKIKYNYERFLGVILSSTYSLKPQDKLYTEYIEQIHNLFLKYSTDGTLTMPYYTRCYIGSL